MAKFKRYDSYKNSSVDWLGQIPSHWEMKSLKYCLKFTIGVTPSSSEESYYFEEEPWITISDMSGKHITKTHFVSKKAVKKCNMRVVPKGSLLYSFKLSVGQVSFTTKDAYTNEAIASFYPTNNTNLKFWYYVLPVYLIRNANKNIYGVYLLNQDLIKNAMIIFPPKDEQKKIASYLDEKIAKIDAFISGKEKFIELLKEQKQIIINDAVTKGLNKNAKFKNSGVEWLGQIPSHWEILKLKFVGKIFAGLSDKKGDDFSKEFTSDKKPFIPFTNVCNNLKIDKNQMQYVKINPHEMQNKVREKDIIFLMSSETLEDIGKCSIYLEKEQLYLNSFCKGFRPNLSRINAEFLNYLLQSKTYRNYFNLAGRGFTRINIKQEYISNLCAILPPKDEQEKIVEYIENKISKIDKLVNLEQECIKSLKEYKASLIDSVVTGKVKV